MLILAGLLSSIVTARFLGPDGRGVFFYWSTVAGVAIQFGNLGLSSSNTYYLAKGQARLSTLAANALWVSVIGGLLLGGLACVILWLQGHSLIHEWPLLWPTLLLIPTGLYFLLATNLLVAIGQIDEYNYFELANRYFGLLLILLAAWFWRTPASLLVMTSLAGVVVCLVLARKIQSYEGRGVPSLSLIRMGFGYAMRAYMATTLAFLVLRVNTFLLERFAGAKVLGLWSIAAQMLDIIILVPSTISLILFPRIIKSDEPYLLMRGLFRNVVIILAIICGLAALIGDWLIQTVFGEQFTGAYEMLLWGLPGAYALGLISIASQYLAAKGMPISLIWVWFAGLVAETLFGVWLVPEYSGNGAMMAFSVAHVTILLMVLWLIRHDQRYQNSKR